MSTPIKWGGEIPVNTTTLSSQDQPERMALANGRFVVVWRDISASGGDTNGQAVRGQMPNTDGSKRRSTSPPIPTSPPRTPIRSSTSCCSVPSRAAPPSPGDGYEPARDNGRAFQALAGRAARASRTAHPFGRGAEGPCDGSIGNRFGRPPRTI